jgi:hypothetical protein
VYLVVVILFQPYFLEKLGIYNAALTGIKNRFVLEQTDSIRNMFNVIPWIFG